MSFRKTTSAALAAALIGCSSAGQAPTTPPANLDPDLVQRGARLFIDPALSAGRERSCSTCHPGGGADSLVWAAGRSVDAGADGGRRTRSLRGAWQAAPYFWDASAPDLRSALERMLAVEMGGAKPGPRDMAALETYLLTIRPFDRGRIQADGTPTEPVTLAARRGWDVFRRARCDTCHPPAAYLVPRPADVGTGGPIDVPSLRGVTERAPYGHDGRWATLEDATLAMLRLQKLELSFEERLQLQEYLKLL